MGDNGHSPPFSLRTIGVLPVLALILRQIEIAVDSDGTDLARVGTGKGKLDRTVIKASGALHPAVGVIPPSPRIGCARKTGIEQARHEGRRIARQARHGVDEAAVEKGVGPFFFAARLAVDAGGSRQPDDLIALINQMDVVDQGVGHLALEVGPALPAILAAAESESCAAAVETPGIVGGDFHRLDVVADEPGGERVPAGACIRALVEAVEEPDVEGAGLIGMDGNALHLAVQHLQGECTPPLFFHHRFDGIFIAGRAARQEHERGADQAVYSLHSLHFLLPTWPNGYSSARPVRDCAAKGRARSWPGPDAGAAAAG